MWEYNLHYFEYLWPLEFDSAKAVVGDWIANHPLEHRAPGWEPYPTSLRLMNWCAVFFARHAERTGADRAFRAELWRSIYLQAEWLLRHVETHLMGNHLLENAVALAFCGSCFGGEAAERWKRAGMDLLSEQIPEQILADGCHFEQSPMYHLRAAYALTSLLNTGDAELAEQVREPLERMMSASLRLCHPDGRIALLGDSAFSVYNQPADLWLWWIRVAGRNSSEKRVDPEAFALPDSGYYGARHPNGHYLICDAGPMGPDSQMGHAHGDLFSFELSLRGHRVICDSGVHGYDGDPYRAYCRSTRAHNTIEIDGEDQCEFWATFRVARRARPREIRWETTEDGFRLSGWHDGYERLPGKPRHYRQFSWHERGALAVKDRVVCARSVSVASRLHLHPDCEIVDLESQTARIRAPGGDFYVAFAGRGSLEVEKSVYCPEFGVAIENQALVFSSAGADIEMGFCISDESLDDARSLSDSLFPS
ncbi:MAG: alginate lyase family protein [Myxococcales bacterium]|nr:alginate lyase family protein [Myxococcales bacterium]